MRTFIPVLLMLAAPAFAQGSGPAPAMANRQLPDTAKEAAAMQLMRSLRCIQCQGQSIADSDAAMAGTMRSEVRQQIAIGQKPEAIRGWMIQRYGAWVSFEPDFKGAGLLLWLTPLILLFVSLLVARGLFRRRA
jgi:cytochrome c-type biogenesis protein CcmH